MNIMSSEYLTVRELAELLRIRERKVYDLASSGEVPCTRATGKLLFARREIDAWLASRATSPLQAPRRVVPRDLFLGSHDPLLDWALKESGCALASYFDGSMDGLERFANGEGIATGLHLYEPADASWNVDTVRQRFADQPVVLVEFCLRERGLIVQPKLASAIRGIPDLRGRRVSQRQPQAGSQILLMQLLRQHGIDEEEITCASTAHTETDAAVAVLEGEADAALGLRSLAQRYRLDFVPVIRERYDLLVDRRAWFEAPFQAFFHFCASDRLRERAATMAGHDVSGFGTVHFNGA